MLPPAAFDVRPSRLMLTHIWPKPIDNCGRLDGLPSELVNCQLTVVHSPIRVVDTRRIRRELVADAVRAELAAVRRELVANTRRRKLAAVGAELVVD